MIQAAQISEGKENINIQNKEISDNLSGQNLQSSLKISQGKSMPISDTKPLSNQPPSLPKAEIKLIEWRFNQFLGEKLNENEILDEENQSYIISDLKMSENGDIIVAGDKGGRIILFQKLERSPKNKPITKLQYYHEFSAYDKDFDVHKSTEYSEAVRCLSVLPTSNPDKTDILSCGFRTVRLNRVYNSKQMAFVNDDYSFRDNKGNSLSSMNISIPKLRSIRYDLKSKTKLDITIYNSNELNSLNYNKIFNEQFLTRDDSKVLLWDMNHSHNPYLLINFDEMSHNEIEDYQERITKSLISDKNPHVISYGTNYGNINIFDTRTSSDYVKYSTSFLDEFLNITNAGFNLTKTIFSSQVMAVHDLNFSLSDENLFASRHFLSVNIWDKRNNKAPLSRLLLYEPVITKLSYLYLNKYLSNDKFSLSVDKSGKYIVTGGYNNMFHIFDLDQKLNSQITMDSSNEKMMNTNIIRKISNKGSCYYKKDDPTIKNINFNKKISKIYYSPVDNFLVIPCENCLYTYNGNVITKKL